MRSPLLVAVVALVLANVAPALPAPAESDGDALLECTDSTPSTPPPAWAGALSPAVETGVVREEHVVESADGTRLSVKSYRPTSAGGAALPTILILSPYHAILFLYLKELEEVSDDHLVEYADCAVAFFTARGYNVVLGDMRGTRNSGGCFTMGGPEDTADGVAIVGWIAERSWSDGSVGMYGVSHVGMSQLLTALGQPPALKAIIPIAAPTQFYRYLHMNGARYVLNTGTPPAYAGAVEAPPPTNALDPGYAGNVAGTLCGYPEYGAQSFDFSGDFDAFWKARDYIGPADKYRAPIFLVHGLVDENVKTDHFDALWPALRAQGIPVKGWFTQHGHSEPEHDWWNVTALRWFDHWLKGIDTGMLAEPRVTYERSDGSFHTAADWPPPATATSLWLAAGDASFAPPTATSTASFRDLAFLPMNYEAPDALLDPLFDGAGRRLVYESAPLPGDLAVTGAIRVELVASSDATDTNFAVHVEEVLGDEVRYVTRGYLDARHRESLETGLDLVPGATYPLAFDLYPRSHVFAEGSVIRVVVGSTDECGTYPLYGNLYPDCGYTGIVPDTTLATNTVYEGPGLTRLVLPVE